jgi:hypothetical protein
MRTTAKLTFLTGFALAFAGAAAAAVLDEWTFTSGPVQKSDIQGKSMANWNPDLADTSVPSAGLLRDSTGGNSKGAWYGDNLGLSGAIGSLILTVNIADINHTDRDYWFEFLGEVGGHTRLDINAWNGQIYIDVWGAGTELDGKSIFKTADYDGAISMKVVATWDFVNNTLSYTVSGDGEGYSGKGSSAFTETKSMSADLSGITNVKQVRARGGQVSTGEYIDLDSVTIETTAAP